MYMYMSMVFALSMRICIHTVQHVHYYISIQGYHVYKIVEGSPADLCGKIKIGDHILEVSDVIFVCVFLIKYGPRSLCLKSNLYNYVIWDLCVGHEG